MEMWELCALRASLGRMDGHGQFAPLNTPKFENMALGDISN